MNFSVDTFLQKQIFKFFLLGFYTLIFNAVSASIGNNLSSESDMAITKYEAEDAALSGVSIANALSGFSGTGYMDGGTFDVETDKITFTVNVANAAAYPLFIRFQNTCGVCDKAQNISINGGPAKYTDFPGTSGSWEDLKVGNVDLKAGNNTIAISKSWGWTHIDYIGIGENDITAPAAPTNQKVSNLTQTSFSLSWNAAIDNVGVTGYDIYFGNTLKASVADTFLTILNFNCATEYSAITVKAKDAAGNISVASNSISVTTKICIPYTLTVNNGIGSGSYNSGKIVSISANAAPAGKIFDKWIGSDAITNSTISITTIVIPESATEITATYKDIDPAILLDTNSTSETVALWNYLKSVYGQKMLTGCWTESQFGGNDKVESCSGETPAIWGQDMNSWYKSRTDQNWINTWNNNIQGFKTAHKRGQILQVNWHWQMPSSKLNGAYTRDAWGKDAAGNVQMMTTQQWSDMVTPGTSLYNAMIEDIDYHVVNFLKKIVDDKGKPIPVIFRPLHEIDGGWFWWTCTSDPTKTAKLFKIMQDRIINFHGVHNLIWVYNPGVVCNGGSNPPFQNSELARRKAFYPGDAFCDITGIDLYEYDPVVRGTFAGTGKTYRDAWNMMKAIAPTKMIALCEAEGLPDPAKCFTDPKYAPWLFCLPWFSDQYSDNTDGATRNLCDWNKVQFKSSYVINAGDFVLTSANTIPVFDKSKINIYPNPVNNGMVTIENFAQIQEGTVQISILDLTGRKVQQNSISANSDEKSIALYDLKSGVYILECRNGNFRQVEKLIIQ
jgi:mannan endo-1,4-beta-mannosidase